MKEIFKQKRPLIGAGIFSTDQFVARRIFQCEPDWLWICLEHSPWSFESIAPITVEARNQGIMPIVRVGWNEPDLIKRAYDIGAYGVMVPQVDSASEAEQAVKYARYPPVGERGVAPWFAGYVGLNLQDVFDKDKNENLLLLQMESLESLSNIDEILSVDGYDILIVGPTDLSASMGIHGDIHNEKIVEIMENVVEKANKAGKILGSTFLDPLYCEKWIKAGYPFMNIADPLSLGTVRLKKEISRLKKLTTGRT
ncbi:MAG: aldolase [Dehalococcoidia bacterium]|nr:aldolase [Dehalococcoidia bacterium]